ncbi:MAG TPA: electron transport complex subunit RsxC [Gammaproteobacteria bacterium]|nr:electron transport complex subunit RsxC [Gammaproteobacteria bacterium]
MTLPQHAWGGGVRVPRHKNLSNTGASRVPPLPARLIYPLRSHIGTAARPIIKPGDRVLRGQCLAQPDTYVSQALHAATSGVVRDIGDFPVAPGDITATCIVIEVDGEGRSVDPWPPLSADADGDAIQRRLVEAGVIGMGGAGFPSHVKVREGLTRTVQTLIINGVECEPYITCDDRLMREHATGIVAGARWLKRAVNAGECFIAVEEDMPEALAALQSHAGEDVTVGSVPAIYPAGGEKQLIKMLTGREVPSKGLPIQAGVLMHNVATAQAVYQAVVEGRPLMSRYVTVTGSVQQPGNWQALLGTPVSHLLQQSGWGGYGKQQVIMGGPMMGMALSHLEVPVTKVTNCLLVQEAARVSMMSMPCIRCGECLRVCPVQLNARALYEYARAGDLDAAQDLHLFDCIECGACAYVCPSHIPLVSYYRQAKAGIAATERRQQTAAENRRRYERHEQRLAADQTAPETAESASPAGTMDKEAMRAEITAAVERVRAKRAANEPPDPTNGGESGAA